MLRTYFSDHILKIFPVRKGRILDLSPVVIYGIYGVPQKRRNVRRLGYSELDQSEDPELRIEQFAFLEHHTAVVLEKSIEVTHESRIQGQKRGIECLVEVPEFGLVLLTGNCLLKLIQIA